MFFFAGLFKNKIKSCVQCLNVNKLPDGVASDPSIPVTVC